MWILYSDRCLSNIFVLMQHIFICATNFFFRFRQQYYFVHYVKTSHNVWYLHTNLLVKKLYLRERPSNMAWRRLQNCSFELFLMVNGWNCYIYGGVWVIKFFLEWLTGDNDIRVFKTEELFNEETIKLSQCLNRKTWNLMEFCWSDWSILKGLNVRF